MMNKYKIGYIDEDRAWRIVFSQKFNDMFDVVTLSDFGKMKTPQDVLTLVETNSIEALVVDYNLAEKGTVSFNGNEVVSFFKENKSGFPLLVLTSYQSNAEDSVDDVFYVIEKKWLNDENRLTELKEKIIKSIEKYHSTIDQKESEIIRLESKKTLTPEEETRLLVLHEEMRKINPDGYDLNPELLKTSTQNKLDELLALSRKILNNKEG